MMASCIFRLQATVSFEISVSREVAVVRVGPILTGVTENRDDGVQGRYSDG